ncbi:MAG: tetratricopeptide repeat protein [Myxococcota bacterium]
MKRGSRAAAARVVATMIALGSAAAWPAFSSAQDEDGSALLAQAKILYDDLQYDQALALLRQALNAGEMPRRDVVEVYKYMGFIYLIQGEEKYAEASLQLLLQQDPDHRLNPLLTPPRFIEFFEGVKARARAEAQVLLEHTPPEGFRTGRPFELEAYMVDRGDKVDRLNVYFRIKDGTGSFSSAGLRVDPAEPTRYTGLIPYVFGQQSDSFTIEYYLAALAADGEWLATAGDPRSPHAVSVEVEGGTYEEEKPSIAGRWWFWVGAVGLAGLAGGGLYLGLQPEPEPPDHGGATLIIR